MHQSDQSPYPMAIPETPLRALQFIQGMAANPTIGESVDALCELLKIRKSHGNVEPIQHVLRFGRNLLLDGLQPGIPIAKNCDRGVPCAIERFARHDFEVSFRPLVSIASC